MQKQSAKLKERDIVEESLKQKDKQLTLLKNKHRSAITDLLGHMPDKDFAKSVNRYDSEVSAEVESMKQKSKENHLEVKNC